MRRHEEHVTRGRRAMSLWVVAAALGALGALAGACGGAEEAGPPAPTPQPAAQPAPEPAPAPASTPAAAEPAADTFDRAFIDGMVPHHEMAIEMARAAKDAGLSIPDLVEIADAVIATQQAEIDQMKAWREEWFGSAEIDPTGADALGLSVAEMGMQHDAAAVAGADDVDQAFAAMMIDHHAGAITMARLAIDSSQRDEIRGLAEQIIEAQQREIDVLQGHAAMHHG